MSLPRTRACSVKNTDNQKSDIGSVAPSGAGDLETGGGVLDRLGLEPEAEGRGDGEDNSA